MPVLWATSVVFILPLAMGRSATRPDFTGEWRFNPEKSRLQIAAPTDSRFAIEHREPAFHLTRTLVFGDKENTISLDFTTDGVETTKDLGGDMQARIRAYWDGPVLVVDSTVIAHGTTGSNLVRYALEDQGRTFVATESFRSATQNYDNVWVFDRCDAAHNRG